MRAGLSSDGMLAGLIVASPQTVKGMRFQLQISVLFDVL